jgi:translocation and assembly module TamA
LLTGGFIAAAPVSVRALDRVALTAPEASRDLTQALTGASLTLQAQRDGRLEAQDIFAAARADYARLLGVLYAAGHYSGVITIRVDGREAADIAPLDAPARISDVRIEVRPGPAFVFGRAEVGPLAAGTVIPQGFRAEAVAASGVMRDAAEAAVDGWRAVGHAKAAVGGQALTADHARARLDAQIALAPGPRVTLGELRFSGQERMRLGRLQKIAGFPSGAVFSPEVLRKSAERLRRTGVFRSVALIEDEALRPGAVLDVEAAVVELPLRRIGFGAEVASFDGLTLSGYWLHRNLLGGAERLRIEGEVAQIGASGSGIDYRLGAVLERPATFTPDTTLKLSAEVLREDEADFRRDAVEMGLGLSHIFSDRLTARAGLEYQIARVRENGSRRTFRNLALPVGLTWDRRDNKFDARRGIYVDLEAKPFLGFGTTDSGARFTIDARGYQPLGDRLVFAARLQVGAVTGASLIGTPRDYLFYSGGGGTVRGQPYQSLGVNVLKGGLQRTGGTHFIALSGEVRAKVTDKIGLVGFYDVGRVAAVNFFDRTGDWHAGAGIGVRYATGIGPIRLDLAAPVAGRTGRGGQVYIGIGQAF